MPRAKPADRIQRLEEQRARINAEIRRVKGRESQEGRKRETRRRMLAGGMVLAQVERGELSKEQLVAYMDRFLERDRDRELFGLSPRQTKEAAARPSSPDLGRPSSVGKRAQ